MTMSIQSQKTIYKNNKKSLDNHYQYLLSKPDFENSINHKIISENKEEYQIEYSFKKALYNPKKDSPNPFIMQLQKRIENHEGVGNGEFDLEDFHNFVL